MCPGLVPLHSLMANAEFMHFAFFDNGDGVLGIHHNGRIEPQRMFLTDSGHYLLRIDLFGVKSDQRLNKQIADRLYSHLMSVGRNRSWRDTRHVAMHLTAPSVNLPIFVCDETVDTSTVPSSAGFQ